ncbi:putative ubiquinol-cytochrome C reductase complex, subunit X [Mrakia frigida]|uniref:ubiquinol--cytochrome-c reductase subunit 9 n=1 Tax=Mrakia frigida TaxID=29902 RepID=UPI003FCC1788
MANNANWIYRTLFQKNSIYLAGIFSAAFAFSVGYDIATTKVYNEINAGKQWKDIRHKYVEAADEE